MEFEEQGNKRFAVVKSMADGHKKKTKRRKLGGIGAVTFLLAVLKITKVISWPWVWVLAPIWISALTAVFVFGFILIGGRMAKGKW